MDPVAQIFNYYGRPMLRSSLTLNGYALLTVAISLLYIPTMANRTVYAHYPGLV